jgi:hypothetical protein
MALLQKLASISKRASTIQYRIYDSLSPGDIYRVSRLISIFSKPSKHQVKRDDKFNDEAAYRWRTMYKCIVDTREH